jgi:hypothetical protein
MFSLLHATRGRPDPIRKCPTWWRNNHSGAPENDYEYLFSTDSDDMTLVEVVKKGTESLAGCLPVTGPPEGNVAAYNRAAARATGKVLVQVMDDVQPPNDWDTRLLSVIPDVDEPWVVGVGDCGYGTKKHICTVLVCTKAWHDKCGYLYYPGYHSMFADDDITEKARAEGCLIEAWDKVTLPHMWGMWGRDEVWQETNKAEWGSRGRSC